MDEKTFIKIINERNKIRSELNEKLKNKSFSICEEECYLIEESWDKDLNENFKEYKNGNFNNENYDYNELIPEDGPEFINNIESIINFIKKNEKLKLISRKSIELIYDEEFLNDFNLIKYYSGNNKLIIEYINDEDDDDNKSLLLIDPLNKNKIEERIFIISTEDIEDKEKIILFKNLINKDIDIIKDDIIPFKIYIKFNELINKLKNKEGSKSDKNKLENNSNNNLQNEQYLAFNQLLLTNKINELNKNIEDKDKEINKLSDELQKQIKVKNYYLSINQRQTVFREYLEKTLNNEINKYKEILKEKDKEIQEYKLKIEQNLISKNKTNHKMIFNSQILSKSAQDIFNQNKNIQNEQDLIKLQKELKKKRRYD